MAAIPLGRIIAATADDIIKYGPKAGRVKGLLRMIGNMSDDAAELASRVLKNTEYVPGKDKIGMYTREEALTRAGDAAFGSGRREMQKRARDAAFSKYKNGPLRIYNTAAEDAVNAEVVGDLITPEFYKPLTNPIAVARAFELSVPRTPEGFTNIARSLGERGLITAPKDIRIAQQISQLPPAMQQVYLDLVGEGTDPAQLLQALKLMGQ